MFCNCKSIKKVNKMQERYVRLLTNNSELSYEELIDLTDEISQHQRCLKFLMAEVYKCVNRLLTNFMNDVLTISKHGYNALQHNFFVSYRRFHIEPIRYSNKQIKETQRIRYNQIDLLPLEVKDTENVDSLKSKIKK